MNITFDFLKETKDSYKSIVRIIRKNLRDTKNDGEVDTSQKDFNDVKEYLSANSGRLKLSRKPLLSKSE